MNGDRAKLTVLICNDIIPADDRGGSGRVAWEHARSLIRNGHRVVIVTRGIKGKPRTESLDGIEVHRYFLNPFTLWSILRSVRMRHRIDVVDFHHPYIAFWALPLLGDVPAVYTFHSPWHEEYGIRSADLRRKTPVRLLGSLARRALERRALARVSKIFTASRFMAERLRAIHGFGSITLPLGVDTERFVPAPDRGAVRDRLGIPRDRLVFFTVRNLVSRMGLENLVTAARRVAAAHPRALFIIGGSGYLRQRLEHLIDELDLRGHVRLAGFIPEGDLAAYYQAADVFILPTRLLEGFGLVTLEALACGTPVLATPAGANAEVAGKLGTGFIFDGTGAGEIADGILGFLPGYERDPDEVRRRARELVLNGCSWQHYSAQMENHFYELIES